MLDNLRLIKATLLLVLMFAGVTNIYAQQKSISGVITDAETGETLIGVNVTWASDLSQGTVTDIDGRFILSVPDTLSNLRFSYIGYSTQIVPVTSEMNIQMYGKKQ